MALSLFNMAFALAALSNNRNISGNTKLADSAAAGLLPKGLGLAFPLIVNAQNQAPTTTTPGGGGGTILTLTQVPDVVGSTFQEASDALTGVGLGPPIQEQAYDLDDDSAGKVVQQDPDANSFAPLGSSATLVVSLGAYTGQQAFAIPANVVKQFAVAEQQLQDKLTAAVDRKLRDNDSKLLDKIERLLDKKLAAQNSAKYS